MTNMGIRSGAGPDVRVSEGRVAYALGTAPCTGMGIAWTAGALDSALAGSVRSMLSDEAGLAIIEEALMPLGETDFVAERVQALAKKGFENWRVGEAVAAAYLTDWRGCTFPWPISRDARRAGASLPGADLVGFALEGGCYRLVFGEVKTSSEARYPPGVVYGRSGLRQQINDLRKDSSRRRRLIEYMLLRVRNTDWKALFLEALQRYLPTHSDVRLYGVLIRDVTPDERDLRNMVLELAPHCPAGMDMTFLGIYLPAGRIDDLGKDVRAIMQGGGTG